MGAEPGLGQWEIFEQRHQRAGLDRGTGESDFSGIHLFCFGGYLRTCEWLHRVANGQFRVNDNSGFDV